MYTGYGFRDFEIGDVDVIKHESLFHLFHLTLPNHDYIAHAVSEDGLRWQRVQNALFIGDPKSWDDDMLWTMHVSENPFRPGSWRMFYTGLCMGERGRVQRVGLAHSDDLYTWHKDTSGSYPLEICGPYYEEGLDEGRRWVSFRDPFYFQEGGQGYLLASGRVKQGPVIRRGCVALARESAENQFEFLPPLFHPMNYDDVEVPNVVKLSGRYYLIGSIREDIKVHYWYSDRFEGPYLNFHDNEFLPQGNYAARVARDGDRYLVWNFFIKGLIKRGDHFMAPPKELAVDENGELRLKSFDGLSRLVTRSLIPEDVAPLEPLFKNPLGRFSACDRNCDVSSRSGFEMFLFQGEYADFEFSGDLSLEGSGKCGLVFRVNELGDGYFVSLDLLKGIAQIRAWGHTPAGGIEESFYYRQLQAAHYIPCKGRHSFSVVAYDRYLEFSLFGYVLLSLADDHFRTGRLGFYVESATLRLENLRLNVCGEPETESYPTSLANF